MILKREHTLSILFYRSLLKKKKKQKRLDLGELFCQYPLTLLLLTSLLSVRFLSFCTFLYV